MRHRVVAVIVRLALGLLKVWGNSAGLKARTSPWSAARRQGGLTSSPTSRLSWYVSKWRSS